VLNRFSTVPPLPPCSGDFILRLSNDGHEKDTYLPIAIFGIGDSVFPIWKSGCVLMYSRLAIRAA